MSLDTSAKCPGGLATAMCQVLRGMQDNAMNKPSLRVMVVVVCEGWGVYRGI